MLYGNLNKVSKISQNFISFVLTKMTYESVAETKISEAWIPFDWDTTLVTVWKMQLYT